MSQKISQQSLHNRFEHLVKVISSERFLQMRGLNNDLPFYICEFRASEAVEMQRLQRQLINTLGNLSLPCLGGRGVKVLEINLYDLSIELLQAREGSSEGSRLWDEILTIEPDVDKDSLLELLQNDPEVTAHIAPETLAASFGLDYHFGQVDRLFARVFGE